MQNRNNTKTLRQFILNENPPLDPGQTAEAIKRGFFASVFYHTVYAFKEIAVKSLVMVMTFLSLIEITHDYFYSQREQNRNANFWFKHILGGVLFAAEVLAITFFVAGTIVSGLIAPAIFTAITGTKFALSFLKTIYYGYLVLNDYRHNETYTQEYAHRVQQLKENLKNTFIAASLFAGVLVAFLAPEVPAIAIPTMVALSLKWSAFASLGTAGLMTLGQKIYRWFTKTETSQPTPPSVKEPFIANSSFQLINKLNISDTNQKRYLNNEKFDHLISANIDDLLIKMEILHERNEGAYHFLSQLMVEEKYRIDFGSEKWRALHLLERLLNGENLDLRFNNATYDNSVAGIARYFHDQGLLKSILHSAFETAGGMQKIFVLVDHYCKLNSDILYQAPIVLEEKSLNQHSPRDLQGIIQDLQADAKNNAHTILLKEKENENLRRKFSKIGEMIFSKHTPEGLKSLKKHYLPRSNSLPKM